MSWFALAMIAALDLLVLPILWRGAFELRADDLAFQRFGERTVARVTRLTTQGRSDVADITYQVRGSSGELATVRSRAGVSDRESWAIRGGRVFIPVIYDSRTPTRVRVNFGGEGMADEHTQTFLMAALASVVLVGLGGLSFAALRGLL